MRPMANEAKHRDGATNVCLLAPIGPVAYTGRDECATAISPPKSLDICYLGIVDGLWNCQSGAGTD